MSDTPRSGSSENPAKAPKPRVLVHSINGNRALQACNACRQRKTKCSGTRPTCSACGLRRQQCVWPQFHGDDGFFQQTFNDDQPHQAKRQRLDPPRVRSELPSRGLTVKALDVFRARHLGVEFCAFLHEPSIDVELLRRKSPFFVHALVALSALYMTQEETAEEGFTSAAELSEWHTSIARQHSRQSVDSPSISSIQANLILAMRELLARTLYKAWVFAGIAVRQSQALRLGVEYHSRLPPRQKEVQRRTYWAAFIMDRLTSYYCWRPQMIDLDSVRINLPCPENVFLLREAFTAPNLATVSFPCDVSRLGLLPYFITIFDLWSQAAYTVIMGGRRFFKSGRPSDENSFFRRHENRLDHILDSLSDNTQWSLANWRMFNHMRQGALFVNLHLLIYHARCVMHQEYLPYNATEHVAAGPNSHHRCNDNGHSCPTCLEQTIISRCISSSEAIVEVMCSLRDDEDSTSTSDLQSICGGSALLAAANIQLWIHYLHAPTEASRETSMARVDQIALVIDSWKATWPVAEAWSGTLTTLRRLYASVYAPEWPSQQAGHVEASASATSPPVPSDSEAYERSNPPLTEGNGLPDLHEQLADKVRFILLASLEDTGARDRVLQQSMNPRTVDVGEPFFDGLLDEIDIGSQDQQYAEETWFDYIYTGGSMEMSNASNGTVYRPL